MELQSCKTRFRQFFFSETYWSQQPSLPVFIIAILRGLKKWSASISFPLKSGIISSSPPKLCLFDTGIKFDTLIVINRSIFNYSAKMDARWFPWIPRFVKTSCKLVLRLQWNPAKTKCHGTEKNVRYSGVFVIVKTPL